MRIGVAADHGGFELKEKLAARVRTAGNDVIEFGAHDLTPDDDHPDIVIPLGQAVASGTVDRGVAVCVSGVGASAPLKELQKKFGFDPNHVAAVAKGLLQGSKVSGA